MVKIWRNIALLCVGFMMSACGTAPVTDGTHSSLPRAGSVVIVWGDHPVVTDTMSIWLHKKGLVSIEKASLEHALKAQGVAFTNSTDDQSTIVEFAKNLNADLVVFGDVDQEIRAPMVSVRGFDVGSNKIAWEGSAHYDKYISIPLNDALVNLTCQALATAWGLRETGKKLFQSAGKACLIDSK